MLFDWFTVIAQVVNFLILVFLLKRFLYKPILKAIDEREKRIATQLEEAAQQKTEAVEQHHKFQQLNDELNKKKETLMAEAQKEAEAEHQRLIEDARKGYDELRSRLHESLKTEQSSLSHNLKQMAQQEIFEITRKVLSDLAGTNMEDQIIRVFIQKLKGMGKDEKAQFMAALKPSKEPLTVRSAFDVAPALQVDIEKAVKSLLGSEAQLQFRTSPEEVGGIELSANGFKMTWTIAEYLDSLEKRIIGLKEGLQNNQT